VDAQAVARLADGLLAGTLPDAPAWDVASAVKRLADGVDGLTPLQARHALRALNDGRQY